ncbi:unnamed protein product [Peronospora effusa]|nr:unnamed protein product [Peronospora effusa]
MTTNGLSDEEDDSEEGRKMHRDIVSKLHFVGGKGDADAPEIEEVDGRLDKKTRKLFFEAKATERRMLPKEAAAKERDCHAQFEKERVLRMHGADADDIDKEKAEGDAEDGDDNEELDESEEGESEAESV